MNETWQGLTFAEFKALSDEELEQFRQRRKQEATDELKQLEKDPTPKPFDEDKFFNTWNEIHVWRTFNRWRTYGIPDRNVTYEEAEAQLSALVAERVQNDPNYGWLAAEYYDNLPEHHQELITAVFEYFYLMRDATEYPYIDSYSLEETLGLEPAEIEDLVSLGVLAPNDQSVLVGNIYYFGEPYYEHLLRQKVLPESFPEAPEQA